jgi:hypothetical protein
MSSTGIPVLSHVERLVADALSNQELKVFPGGYRLIREQGATELTFRRIDRWVGNDLKLSAIATVETRFAANAIPEFTNRGLSRLNRRAVFGSFFRDSQGIGLRMTFSVYEQEPAANWVASILLQTFVHQLAFGIGVGQSEISDELLRQNRANLEYARRWAIAIPPSVFEEVAKQFNNLGIVSSPAPNGLVLEVAMADGAASRMIDSRAETALLTISTGVPHPIAGVGYLATIALPIDPKSDAIDRWCDSLNTAEHIQDDFVPRMGAWGARGLNDELVHCLFWPSDRGEKAIVQNIATWTVQRAIWLRRAYWIPGVGLKSTEDRQ